ncbi:MAG: CRISPR-associated endonuclease Cas2 [Hyphomonadaceae bacterium]
MKALSGYRIMWILAVFDLPVGTALERKKATKFRKYLLDQGFVMMQFSVYLRFTASKEHADSIAEDLSRNVPKAGKVDVLFFTDKQYGAIRTYRGKGEAPPPRKPNQLELF